MLEIDFKKIAKPAVNPDHGCEHILISPLPQVPSGAIALSARSVFWMDVESANEFYWLRGAVRLFRLGSDAIVAVVNQKAELVLPNGLSVALPVGTWQLTHCAGSGPAAAGADYILVLPTGEGPN